jgi:dTMP kinase
MPNNRGPGILIAFEGIDGAGKTTQAALLASVLKRAGETVVSSKEPTNGDWGRRIRESARSERHSPNEELKFFLRDREEHSSSVIRPSLAAGHIVILDRYYYSTIAYQGARGYSVDGLQRMMEGRFVIPDVVFLLDIPPEISLARIADRGDKPNAFERLEGLAKARTLFSSIPAPEVTKLDGNLPIQFVQNAVLNKFVDGPLKARRCAKDYVCHDFFLHCAYRLTNTCSWALSSDRIQAAINSETVHI